jgi:hypothetical protein
VCVCSCLSAGCNGAQVYEMNEAERPDRDVLAQGTMIGAGVGACCALFVPSAVVCSQRGNQ